MSTASVTADETWSASSSRALKHAPSTVPATRSTVLASVAPAVGSSSRITVMPAQPGLLHWLCVIP
jgi:hypothetical protein